MPETVLLIRGDDPALVGEALHAAIHEAAAGEDLSLGTDDFASEDYVLAAAVDAAQTAPMFTTRRVVVARGIGRFNSEDVEALLDYLSSPVATTTLILTGGGGQVSRKVVDAVKRVGRVLDAGAPSGKARAGWLHERLAGAPVRLDPRAAQRLGDHLGDDLGRLSGILEVLAAVYGQGARVDAEALEPFLGNAGSGAPWDLTDAIDRGDANAALDQLDRQFRAGDRHPLQVMASLGAHYARMVRLDGAGCRDETDAAKALGMTGSTFPAKKALTQARRLGHDGLVRALELLSAADLDLRGRVDLPGEAIIEVLVARLARLTPTGRAAR